MVEAIAAATERFAPMVKGSPAGPRRFPHVWGIAAVGAQSRPSWRGAVDRPFRPPVVPFRGIGSSLVAGPPLIDRQLVAGGRSSGAVG